MVAQVTTQWCLSICKKSHRSIVADSFPVLYRDMCVTSLINGTGGEKDSIWEKLRRSLQSHSFVRQSLVMNIIVIIALKFPDLKYRSYKENCTEFSNAKGRI